MGGVPLKTEQRRIHTTVLSFRRWVRRAEMGCEICGGPPPWPQQPVFCCGINRSALFYLVDNLTQDQIAKKPNISWLKVGHHSYGHFSLLANSGQRSGRGRGNLY
jgi:hypothetical protein